MAKGGVPVWLPGPGVPAPGGLMPVIRRKPHRIEPPAVSRCGKFSGAPGQRALPALRIGAQGKRADRGGHVVDPYVFNARTFAPSVT
eukprot:5272920-Pyramimonas_sp.AAC.1